MLKKEGRWSNYVGEHQPQKDRQKMYKVGEDPKICQRKFNFEV